MRRYHFRILNVFAETSAATFSGNPLCVFEDARGLSDDTMQALTRQFNLSETTFIFPSEQADVDAHVRIFTPTTEMRFAGHPTLGTAHVVRDLLAIAYPNKHNQHLQLEMKAGIVSVSSNARDKDVWTLTAPPSSRPLSHVPTQSPAILAQLFALTEDDLLSAPLWLDTGSEQLLIPLKSVDAVRRAKPDSNLLVHWPKNNIGLHSAYLFAFTDQQQTQVEARFFFGVSSEDPGTGSACANLGGWMIATGRELPQQCEVHQGAAIHRPCRLLLNVAENQQIKVGGRVNELGRGSMEL
ncbi:PhzF family phenazine biosynthesis protein [Glaciimonas soli]|uniref:PhzF family phenazine biosynthesis isomerase n=1 Tax=Glaciimonas soli TaxID=2590999 RepID=A0A843YR49_9BURK|nr:PhzF family phenazine biosynthesis protein [Glaciimonas soli]MQQ99977.1 PhzF family phenazine biosynthesis isomerase [Glaciimonas soli]